ncbi:MAG: HAD hydrolase-like protein [Rhodospirillaceae bacterium]|nr:HAD hydrolase-like protein [Rhodospirillaceae bacterium]
MPRAFLAAIFDLDGVITNTAMTHARAWKAVIDPRVDRPFDLDRDYKLHVAGRPRADGLKDFFASREMVLPDDDIAAMSARKNDLYLELLESEGVRVNPEMIARMALYSAAGLKIGIASGSKNARKVIDLACLTIPGVLVDGHDVEALGLRPKPAPDIFIHVAQILGVAYAQCIVFEDSRAALAQIAPARGVLVEMP